MIRLRSKAARNEYVSYYSSCMQSQFDELYFNAAFEWLRVTRQLASEMLKQGGFNITRAFIVIISVLT